MIAGAVMRARETRFSFRVLREEKNFLTERVHTRVARLTSTPATMFRVVACVTNTTTCQTFVGTPVASSALRCCPSWAGYWSQPRRPSKL